MMYDMRKTAPIREIFDSGWGAVKERIKRIPARENVSLIMLRAERGRPPKQRMFCGFFSLSTISVCDMYPYTQFIFSLFYFCTLTHLGEGA